MTKIFVYGTLKRGHGNHEFLRGSKFLGDYKIKGFELYTFPGGIPHVIPGNGIVVGEVYEVDDFILNQLDMLEGHPRFYCRTPISGTGVEIYIGKPYSGMPKIESGVY